MIERQAQVDVRGTQRQQVGGFVHVGGGQAIGAFFPIGDVGAFERSVQKQHRHVEPCREHIAQWCPAPGCAAKRCRAGLRRQFREYRCRDIGAEGFVVEIIDARDAVIVGIFHQVSAVEATLSIRLPGNEKNLTHAHPVERRHITHLVAVEQAADFELVPAAGNRHFSYECSALRGGLNGDPVST